MFNTTICCGGRNTMDIWKVLFLLGGLLNSVKALRCYQCTGIAHPENCTTIKECHSSDMLCHGSQYLIHSQFKYDLDCKGNKTCSTLESAADETSSIEAVGLWSSCCHENYCNKNFNSVGAITAVADRELHCYHCKGVDDPINCNVTKKCNKGEVCYTTEKFNNSGREIFDLDCIPRKICLMSGNHLPFGKRRTLCKGCCDLHDNCNNQFCSKTLGITNMTAIVTSTNSRGTTRQPTPITTLTTQTTTSIYNNYNLIVTPNHLVGILDEETTFKCKLDPVFPHLGKVTGSWYFSGRQKPIYSHLIDNADLFLKIKSLAKSDAGTYTCEVNTTDYSWTNSGHLVIENGIPTITERPQSQLVYLNRKVTLHCQVAGIPSPTVQWTFTSPSGSRYLPAGTSINMNDTVIIPNMTVNHLGTWTCQASNSHGQVHASAILGLKQI